MSDPANEFAALKAMHEASVLLKEGGRPVALLSSFTFVAAGCAETMDLLLVPFNHSGYETRLFFERKIDSRGRNWNHNFVVDRKWWAPSWNDVHVGMPWPAMLCAHLRAVE